MECQQLKKSLKKKHISMHKVKWLHGFQYFSHHAYILMTLFQNKFNATMMKNGMRDIKKWQRYNIEHTVHILNIP